MNRPAYPFAAIVGQEQMKMALLLSAVDWRLGVLLRGDKGAGKTTTARALAELLPKPGRFINLPIGITEDRLLGGMDLGSTLKGEPALRSGLLAEANGGVLYVDEVNLLPDHLADALLDAAATGVSTVEREGFSAVQEARFVLMGSMNPEEGSLRPQLLDRFALVADIAAIGLPTERREVVERRMSYDTDPSLFTARWMEQQVYLQQRIQAARVMLPSVRCSTAMLEHISTIVCDHGVMSIRADLAIARASCAQAAMLGCEEVTTEHIGAVLPLALAHRITRSPQRPPPGNSPSPLPQTPPQSMADEGTGGNDGTALFFPSSQNAGVALDYGRWEKRSNSWAQRASAGTGCENKKERAACGTGLSLFRTGGCHTDRPAAPAPARLI